MLHILHSVEPESLWSFVIRLLCRVPVFRQGHTNILVYCESSSILQDSEETVDNAAYSGSANALNAEDGKQPAIFNVAMCITIFCQRAWIADADATF